MAVGEFVEQTVALRLEYHEHDPSWTIQNVSHERECNRYQESTDMLRTLCSPPPCSCARYLLVEQVDVPRTNLEQGIARRMEARHPSAMFSILFLY
jgi:hypothetical protein